LKRFNYGSVGTNQEGIGVSCRGRVLGNEARNKKMAWISGDACSERKGANMAKGIMRWLAGMGVTLGALLVSSGAGAQNIVVDVTPSHVVNTFSPPHALGGAIDRLRSGDSAPGQERAQPTKERVDRNTDMLLSDPVLKEILGAGWQTVTYRQNTELMVEDWHWNAAGEWSNEEK
jgi:hypothetical protein